MNAFLLPAHQRDFKVLAPLVSTLGIVMFLFFIDEGYYSMKWMLEGGNWVVFFIYFIILFPIQLGISEIVFRNAIGKRKLGIMILVAMPATIVMLMGIFYFIGS